MQILWTISRLSGTNEARHQVDDKSPFIQCNQSCLKICRKILSHRKQSCRCPKKESSVNTIESIVSTVDSTLKSRPVQCMLSCRTNLQASAIVDEEFPFPRRSCQSSSLIRSRELPRLRSNPQCVNARADKSLRCWSIAVMVLTATLSLIFP
jgi:hypothetical protein